MIVAIALTGSVVFNICQVFINRRTEKDIDYLIKKTISLDRELLAIQIDQSRTQ